MSRRLRPLSYGPVETMSFGGDGGNRTRVRDFCRIGFYRLIPSFVLGAKLPKGRIFCSAVPKLLFRRRDIQRKSEAIPLLDYLNIWRLLFVFCLLPDTHTSRRNPFVPYILYHIISMSTSVSPISCSSLNLNILTVLNAFSSSLYIIGLIFSPCASR